MMTERRFERQRAALVALLQAEGIQHEGVLAAIGRVPRHAFVDQALQSRAYLNEALPIGFNQTISQPLTVAHQTALLDPKAGERILEIGLGSGYQAAVLCEMGVQVFSIERHEDLTRRATQRLKTMGYRVMTLSGDGHLGWEVMAPFDGIIVTAGAREAPQTLMQQLRLPAQGPCGGRLIVPIGPAEIQRMMRCTRLSKDDFQWEELGSFRFVPFVKGFGEG